MPGFNLDVTNFAADFTFSFECYELYIHVWMCVDTFVSKPLIVLNNDKRDVHIYIFQFIFSVRPVSKLCIMQTITTTI